MAAARTKPRRKTDLSKPAKSDLARVASRPDGTTVVLLKKSTAEALLSSLGDERSGDIEDRMNAVMGCQTSEVALHLVAQLAEVHHPNTNWEAEEDVDRVVIHSTAMVAELKPANAMQAMLAAQMNTSHRLAMKFSERALLAGQTFEGADANTVRASRFMRLFIEQAQCYDRLQGRGGQQKVTVEHVTVNDGGQAIVGNISKGPGGGA